MEGWEKLCKQPTGGLGVSFNEFNIDYAFLNSSYNYDLGSHHIFLLVYLINGLVTSSLVFNFILLLNAIGIKVLNN